MVKGYLVICCCRVKLEYMKLLPHYQVSPNEYCLQTRWGCEIWKAFHKFKNAIDLKDIKEERWGSTQREGHQVEYLPTSLHCFPCSPEPAGKIAPFPIFQGKLTESLNSLLGWAAHGQCGHLFLNLAGPIQAALAHSLCCDEQVSGCALTFALCSEKMIFSAAFLRLPLQPEQELRYRAAPWLALAVLTLLKAAVSEGEVPNVN